MQFQIQPQQVQQQDCNICEYADVVRDAMVVPTSTRRM